MAKKIRIILIFTIALCMLFVTTTLATITPEGTEEELLQREPKIEMETSEEIIPTDGISDIMPISGELEYDDVLPITDDMLREIEPVTTAEKVESNLVIYLVCVIGLVVIVGIVIFIVKKGKSV